MARATYRESVPVPTPWSDAAPPWQRRLFLALPLVALPPAIALDRLWPGAYWFAVREDSVVEWATVVVYLAAAALGLSVARLLRRRAATLPAALHLLLALGFLLVAGEEVSWGQRVLGFAGPEVLVERNQQDEANLHNLLGRYALHAAYIAVGVYGVALGRVLVRRVPRLRDAPDLYAPPPVLAPYFAGVVLYYAWVDYVNPVVVRLAGPAFDLEEAARLQEVPELFLATGFALFLVLVRDRLRAEQTAAPAPHPDSGAPGRADRASRAPR